MSEFIHKLFTSYKARTDGDTRIGELNRIWYDSITNTLRIQLDDTPGGTVIGGGGAGGDYTLPTASTTVKGGVKVDGSTITINNQVISGFSGSYTDLTNKPTIPSAYTLPTATDTILGGVKIGSNITINAGVISVAAPFSGSYTDLTDKPNIPSLTGYATETFVTTRGYLTSVGTISYNDLSNKPTIPAAYTFNVAADDSTLRTIGTEETVKFVGAGGITTASDAEGAITITQGSTDQIIKVAGSFASDQPFKSEVIADLVNGVTINTWMGLPAFATTKSWKFGYNGNLTFPNTTVQTTAYTGNAATVTNGVYTTDTGTVTNTMLAGSIANDKLANSSITINGTSISLGSSATILAANPNALTIGTGLSGTNYTGGSAVTIALASGYGDTQNPYASKTANNFLAAPNGSNGAPTFRAIVAADIPTLNQNTTGSAATLTTARNINGVSFNGSAAINIPTLTDGTNSIKITAVPASINGAPGDVVGSVAFDSTYIYYCFQEFTGTSYSLPVISGLGEFSERVNAGSSELRTAIVAAFAATPAGWSYGGYPVNNITAATGTSINIFRDYGGPIFNGTSYTLIQPSATANWKITPWGATTSAAAAGSLTGNTLASGVTASSLTSVGTLTSLNSGAITTTGTLAVNASGGITTNQTTFSLINSSATTVNFAGAATTLSVGAATGTTTINNNLSMASGKTIGTTATVTSNHTTAFSAGDSAISNVALSVPQNAAIRDRTNGASVIYFDVSNGGTTNGEFQFRSSSAFTNVLTMSPTGFNVNTNAVVTARTPSLARTAFNAAMGTELTVDNMRFRITNSGLAGIFPQVIGNGSARNLAWTVVAARSGSAVTQAGSTGTIVASDAWTTLYSLGGMDSSGDTFTATLQDKGEGRIYRVTFMRSDQAGGDGFNIIAERLL